MNFSRTLNVTHSTIVKGGSDDDAARAAFTALKKSGATLASLLKQDREHTDVTRSVSAAYRSLVASMRAVLVGNALDVTSASVVRDAIRFNVWLDEGFKAPLVNGKAAPLNATELKKYNEVSQRISRLARDIVGETKPMPEVVKVVVPRALRATVKAATLDAGVDYKVALATLKAVYGK